MTSLDENVNRVSNRMSEQMAENERLGEYFAILLLYLLSHVRRFEAP